MKNVITTLSMVSLFFMCPFISQAQDETSTRQFDYGIPEECRIDDRLDRVAYQITRSCAIECIAKYEAYLHTVEGGDLLIRGVEIDRSELLRIIERSEIGDQIFVMSAIMPNDSTGAILMVKPRGYRGQGDIGDDDGSTFFDFTAPCPTTCPW